MKEKYCLLAISGDMSHNGMSDKSEMIEVKEKHFDIVEEFLMAQTLFKIKNLKAYYDRNFFESKESRKAHKKYWKAVEKLYQASIFEHKYQARTEWELCLNNEYELDCVTIPFKWEKSSKKEFYNKIKILQLYISLKGLAIIYLVINYLNTMFMVSGYSFNVQRNTFLIMMKTISLFFQ